MATSLFSALTGLSAHQQWIDMIGNNLANANTPGYKATRATFASAFSQTLRYGSAPTGSPQDANGILIPKDNATEDQLMEIAVGAGADDYSDAGDDWQLLCDPSAFESVQKALETGKIATRSANLGYVPKNKREVSGRDAELCLSLAEALDDHDDGQNVFSDFDVSDDEMNRIAGES